MVILIGCLIAFSAAFTVATDGLDRVSTAQDDRADRLLDRQNTAIEIGDVTRNGEEDETLALSITNTGSTALSIDKTDLLVDGEYHTEKPTIMDTDGETKNGTTLWLPGDTLEYELSDGERVKVVTQHGVSASALLEEA